MADLKKIAEKLFINTYTRYPILIQKAKGVFIYSEGKEYLDLIGGIGVIALGHSNKEVLKEIKRQLNLFMHVSNLFWQEPQIKFANEFLKTLDGNYRIFLSNSGAEAVEAALKFAKLPFSESKRGFLAFYGSFHGRTHGALSATWKEDFRKPFSPLLPNFNFVEYGNLEQVENELKKNTYCAVIVEPIQGEAGVISPPPGFLYELKKLCERYETLLIVDEIQTGVGKTGKFWAYEWENIKPDILVSAKAIGGGLPLGVTAVSEEISRLVKPGMHASTFGGNPISCAAGKVVIKKVNSKKLLKDVLSKGEYLKKELKKIGFEVEGKGLMLGVKLGEIKREPQDIRDFFLKRKIIVNVIKTHLGETKIRILPPLIISKKELDLFLEAVEELKRTL
ncbi:MAG: aspartate aminotransferase family protein [Candidatus Calescibacterium sp.]|jgi:predicted acetylornithine/succinylornithine family transaminase|nr:aspartate aminotransferase family protein [Candidatus Calescibacterium sp.]